MGADRASGFFWLVFGLLCMYGSIHLGLGTFQEPGPGFFPLLAACFFTLLALFVLAQSFLPGKGYRAGILSLWKGVIWQRPFKVGLLMAGYVMALERMGFLLTSFAVLFIMLKAVEEFPWWKTLLLALSASGCTYLLFHVLLKTALPVGIFGI